MRAHRRFAALLPLLALAWFFEIESGAAVTVVKGGGASFPAITYRSWIDAFVASRPDLAAKFQIEYNSTGSGVGKSMMISGNLTFAGSEAPLTPSEQASAPSLRMIPTIVGAIALAFNVDGLQSLALSRETVLGIFNGTITSWNDTRLTALNPNVTLPAARIQVVVRSDQSGTTEAFTRALDSFSGGQWASRVATTVAWDHMIPSVIRASRSTGISAAVSVVPYSIGYLDTSASSDNLCNARLPTARIVNRHGNLVDASRANIDSALNGTASLFQNTSYLYAPIADSYGDYSYPMAVITTVIVNLEYPPDKCDAAVGMIAFLLWCYSSDAAVYITAQTNNVLVPDVIRDKAREVLMQVQCNNRSVYAEAYDLLYPKSTGVSYVPASSSGTNVVPVAVGVSVGGALVVIALFAGFRVMKARGGTDKTTWLIDVKDLRIECLVGEGSFGKVYRARWRGAIVAVKTVSSQELSISSDLSSQISKASKRSNEGSSDTKPMTTDALPPRSNEPATKTFEGGNKMMYRTMCNTVVRTRRDDATRSAQKSGKSKGSSEKSRGSGKSRASKSEKKRMLSDIAEFKKWVPPLVLGSIAPEEIKTMVALRHPNIVIFMGACLKPGNLCIVTEFMARGSLLDLFDQNDVVFDWPLRLSFAIGASKGMEYLHSAKPPILHLDLKSPNLLIDEFMRLKVSDFGLAALKTDQLLSDTEVSCVGSILWMAPEIATGSRPVSEKCDVYSFGIIMWELLARCLPYQDELQRMAAETLLDMTSQNLCRPSPIPGGCDSYTILMQSCWSQDPDDRPTYEIVSDLITGMDPDSFGVLNWDADRMVKQRRQGSAAHLPAVDESASGDVEAADSERELRLGIKEVLGSGD